MKNFISIRQALDLLNHSVSKSLLYKLVDQKKIKSTRLGGKILIDRDSLDELLDPKTEPAPSLPPLVAPKKRKPAKKKTTSLDLW